MHSRQLAEFLRRLVHVVFDHQHCRWHSFQYRLICPLIVANNEENCVEKGVPFERYSHISNDFCQSRHLGRETEQKCRRRDETFGWMIYKVGKTTESVKKNVRWSTFLKRARLDIVVRLKTISTLVFCRMNVKEMILFKSEILKIYRIGIRKRERENEKDNEKKAKSSPFFLFSLGLVLLAMVSDPWVSHQVNTNDLIETKTAFLPSIGSIKDRLIYSLSRRISALASLINLVLLKCWLSCVTEWAQRKPISFSLSLCLFPVFERDLSCEMSTQVGWRAEKNSTYTHIGNTIITYIRCSFRQLEMIASINQFFSLRS